jgi:hypothetical protein
MRALFTAVIAVCLTIGPSIAQDGTASLTGKVQDISGAIIPGFLAELESVQAPINRFRTVGDAAGVYRFSGLPAGEYDLKLSSNGFNMLKVKSTLILGGEQSAMPIFHLAAGYCGGPDPLDFIRFLPSANNIGNLGGTVRIDRGLGSSTPLPGAGITLICRTGKACGAAKTNADGEFLFKALPPGDFTVRVTKAGFYPAVASSYKVEAGVETVYWPIDIERCQLGNCDPKLRPKKPMAVCE